MRQIIKELGLAGIAILGLIGLASKLNMEKNMRCQEQIEILETQTQENNQEKQDYGLYAACTLAVIVTTAYCIYEGLKDIQRRNLLR